MIEKTPYTSTDHPTREARIHYLKNDCKQYTGFELRKTSKGEEVFIAYRYGVQIEIDVYRIQTHLYDNYVMSLYAIRRDQDSIFVHDITGKKLEGYGSLIMEHLLAYAKAEGIKVISGEFSSLDLENHKVLLLQFYQKFGAECVVNDDNTGGTITLKLEQ